MDKLASASVRLHSLKSSWTTKSGVKYRQVLDLCGLSNSSRFNRSLEHSRPSVIKKCENFSFIIILKYQFGYYLFKWNEYTHLLLSMKLQLNQKYRTAFM